MTTLKDYLRDLTSDVMRIDSSDDDRPVEDQVEDLVEEYREKITAPLKNYLEE